jgi:hypothetical protein|tara:strand:+ start:4041 stop:4721 length:681 start_codon:yes stop_codon:yes gene_type:complete
MTDLYNHLKTKGRYGDTELRYVDGELAHVNKDEASILDKYGLDAEEVVKEYGSGTINPETGLKEYNPLAILTAGKLAFDVGSSIFGFFKGRDINRRVRSGIESQQQLLRSAINDVGEAEGIELEMALEGSDIKKEDTFLDFLDASEDIGRKSDFVLGTQDLAQSGTAMDLLNKERERASSQLDLSLRNEDLRLEKEFANITGSAESTRQGLLAQIVGLDAQSARYS